MNVSDAQLIGIKQYVIININDNTNGVSSLIKLLNSFVYNQCLIFANSIEKSVFLMDLFHTLLLFPKLFFSLMSMIIKNQVYYKTELIKRFTFR